MDELKKILLDALVKVYHDTEHGPMKSRDYCLGHDEAVDLMALVLGLHDEYDEMVK
jgi:hypothetical protein